MADNRTIIGTDDEIIIQLMEMIVMHGDRIKVLEEKFDLLSSQFDSICG